MNDRGVALLLGLLVTSLLAVMALGAAFMARTHLQLARNRALALQADAVALSGAAVAQSRLSAAVRSEGTLPARLDLPSHPGYGYALRSYTLSGTERAHLEITGATPGGGQALIEMVVVFEGGVLTMRLLR